MRPWLVICAVLITTPAYADPTSPSAEQEQPRASALPDVLIGAGSTLLVVSVLYHATEFRYVASKLADATDATPDPAEYDRYSHSFDTRREVLIGLYAASAITLGTAIYLKHREVNRRGVQPSVALVPGGGMITLGWSR